MSFGLYFQTIQAVAGGWGWGGGRGWGVGWSGEVGIFHTFCWFAALFIKNPVLKSSASSSWSHSLPCVVPVLFASSTPQQIQFSLPLSSQNHFTLGPSLPVLVLPMSGWMEAGTWKCPHMLHPHCTVISHDSAEHTFGSQCSTQVHNWKQNCRSGEPMYVIEATV